MQATANETLVAMRTEEGFRVYAPSDPGRSFTVSGTAEYPGCTCPEFQEEINEQPNFRCRHILAVESQLPAEPEEEQPKGENGAAAPAQNGMTSSGAQMLLKRSLSPDGKIDSLSVEFSCPVDALTSEEIKRRATKALGLQDEIMATFLQNCNGHTPENGNGNGRRAGNGNGHGGRGNGNNGYVLARMLDIAGMQTRWGWRLFINVDVNGQTMKLFGNRRELGDHIAAAGYPDLARNVNGGAQLNVPCRVTIKPSEDGRYQNIEQVLPAASSAARGRAA